MAVSAARAAAFDVLLRVVTQNAYAVDLLHAEALEQLSTADHALTMQLVMGTLRWQSLLDSEIAQHVGGGKKLSKLDVEVLISLRLATYQLRHLERIPARAAVNESVELVKRARKRSAAPMVNAVLRKIATMPSSPGESIASVPTSESLARHYAQPEWLVCQWAEQFGIAKTQQICKHNQSIPNVSIRLDSAIVEQELAKEGIELAPGVLVTGARRVIAGDVTHTSAYQRGDISIQDEASQLVALLVGGGRSGERILDCCAAPGGKTSAIAVRNPDAQILGVELHPHRARTMQKLVRAPNVRIVAADALHLPFDTRFERVLADVPCSGTGTLARNPEIKSRLTPEDLADLAARQLAILFAAMEHVAPDGRLVYSTCSLERGENEEEVTHAL